MLCALQAKEHSHESLQLYLSPSGHTAIVRYCYYCSFVVGIAGCVRRHTRIPYASVVDRKCPRQKQIRALDSAQLVGDVGKVAVAEAVYFHLRSSTIHMIHPAGCLAASFGNQPGRQLNGQPAVDLGATFDFNLYVFDEETIK